MSKEPIGGNFALLKPERPEDRMRLTLVPLEERVWTAERMAEARRDQYRRVAAERERETKDQAA